RIGTVDASGSEPLDTGLVPGGDRHVRARLEEVTVCLSDQFGRIGQQSCRPQTPTQDTPVCSQPGRQAAVQDQRPTARHDLVHDALPHHHTSPRRGSWPKAHRPGQGTPTEKSSVDQYPLMNTTVRAWPKPDTPSPAR